MYKKTKPNRKESGGMPISDKLSYSKGFYDGRRYIVTEAEKILCRETGCKTRGQLIKTGKIPTFWKSTLTLCLQDMPNVLNLTKLEEDVLNKKIQPTRRKIKAKQ